MEDDALGDPQTAPQGDRVGRVPVGGEHSWDYLGLIADQGDVERISWDAVGIVGDFGEALERRVMTALHLRPDQWQDAVRDEQVRPERDAERHSHTPHANRAQSRDCRFHWATTLARLRSEITTALSTLLVLALLAFSSERGRYSGCPCCRPARARSRPRQRPGHGDVTTFLPPSATCVWL